MKRHPFDLISLVLGLIIIGIGLGIAFPNSYISIELSEMLRQLGLPVVLMVIGAKTIIKNVRRSRLRSTNQDD